MRMNLAEIAAVIRGEARRGAPLPAQSPSERSEGIFPGAVVPTGAQVDSRRIRPGDLFFCLRGERVDGHDFALDAARAGASAIIAERNPFAEAGEPAEGLPPVLLTPDIKVALWELAARHRDAAGARVIGITGTAGKTSVKEVLSRVLAESGPVERNPMNFNNQIGLPVSMLCASPDASFWVMEAGISEVHDMDELGRILRPDLALILNVGEAHIAGLAAKGVAACKALLLDYIRPDGTAVVCADYPDLRLEVGERLPDFARRGISCRYFSGRPSGNLCYARYEGPAGERAGRYRVFLGDREFVVESPFRGDFGSENVAAVAAAATELGLSAGEIARGMSEARLPEQRFRYRRYGDIVLVDDSYNSNPLSAGRMVRAARVMAEEMRLPLVLVMGEMLELGDRARDAHRTLGLEMAQSAPELVFWKGGQADAVLEGLRCGGHAGGFYPVSGGQEFSLLLDELDITSGLILFKGSRSNQLERLVALLRDRIAPAGEEDA